jgi:uncharacterized membrane protein (UPF0127 family)
MPPRLERLPRAATTAPGLDVRVAATVQARLVGLAGLRHLTPRVGLLLLRTRSVHTFFMRFALDLLWLDAEGRVLRVDVAVPPRRLRCCRRARSVVELSSGTAPPDALMSVRFAH